MYISTWLIIIGGIVGIYFYSRPKKHNSPNMPKIFKQNFSYRLDIGLEPNWFDLYKKASGDKPEKEIEKEFIQKRKKSESPELDLWGRRYYFTEYYNSCSGLTTRLQRVIFPNGKQLTYSVDEFGDSGYFFDSDRGLGSAIDEKDKDREKKLSVDIREDFIRNDIFDKHIGGPKIDFDYEKNNYLFSFPLWDVFNFLFELGQRFHGIEGNTVIKWPDQIEKKFKEAGIEYETHFDYDPKSFDIEKHDKEFFEKWGKPKICLSSSNRFHSAYLVSKDKTYYNVKLKIFRPGENDRISLE